MSEAKKTDAPSAEAIHVAKVLLHIVRTGGISEAELAAVIDEQRREARAEAFERIGAALRSYGELEFAEHAEALAATERAK